MTMNNKDEQVVFTLSNGITIRSKGEEYELGSYVRFCDPNGAELLYWDSEEWRENPEGVMGAVLGA